MKTVFSEEHQKHNPEREFVDGTFHEYFEKPSRAGFVLDAVTSRGFGDVIVPKDFPDSFITAIHEPGYIDFLQTAHAQWQADGREGDAFASAFNVQHGNLRHIPVCVDGKLGIFTGDGSVPFTATSWEAIRASANVALTGQALIADGEASAFALCRPPGHHATARTAAGYCYLNNAAIAAQAFIDGGASRVAILDVDYHHGNGTQDIFYDRNDVLFASIHADPAQDYPYFAGYADERGAGAGEGFNHNYPLPLGTEFTDYRAALRDAVTHIRNFAPDALVISLGTDTFAEDPISQFKLQSPDYLLMGEDIAASACPTLFVMEGGYAIDEIGINAANVLEGFLGKYAEAAA